MISDSEIVYKEYFIDSWYIIDKKGEKYPIKQIALNIDNEPFIKPKYETNFANLLNGKYKKIAKKSDIINLNRLGILEIIILIMLINLDISL